MQLTEEQKKAVNSAAVHRLFVAGPGTGKSETILGFIDKAVNTESTEAASILVLAFTRAATADLRRKIARAFPAEAKVPTVQTLHAFSLRQVMKNSSSSRALPADFSIADDFDERHIVQEDLKRLLSLDRIEAVRDLFRKLSANWETLNADRTGWESDFESPEFIGAWLEHREIYGYVLRSELVYQLKNLLTQEPNAILDGPVSYLVVDEYQDMNRCDLKAIHALAERGAHLVCAGDDDQSIYAFRYAFPEGIRLFGTDVTPSEQFVFTKCFRCDSAILSFALSVIRQDYGRVSKRIESVTGGKGLAKVLRFASQKREASKIADLCLALHQERSVPFEEMIILLRSNHQGVFSEPIEAALLDLHIAVQSRKDLPSVFDEPEGRYFTALVKLAVNSNNDLALRTIVQLTPGVGPVTIDQIYSAAKNEKRRFAAVLREVVTGARTDIRVTSSLVTTLGNLFTSDVLDRARAATIEAALDLLLALLPFEAEGLGQYLTEFVKDSGITNLGDFVSAVADIFGPGEQDRAVKDAVRIMTMHQAKGLSADACFLVGVEEEYTPGRGSVDEERRLLYVSLTRARHFLFLTHCVNRNGRQGYTGFLSQRTTRRHLSRFISNLPGLSDEDGDSFGLPRANSPT